MFRNLTKMEEKGNCPLNEGGGGGLYEKIKGCSEQ